MNDDSVLGKYAEICEDLTEYSIFVQNIPILRTIYILQLFHHRLPGGSTGP